MAVRHSALVLFAAIRQQARFLHERHDPSWTARALIVVRNSAFLLTRVTSGKLQGDQEGNLRAFTLAPHRYSPTIMDCEGARDCLARRPAIGTKRTIAAPFLSQLLTHSGPTPSSSLQRP